MNFILKILLIAAFFNGLSWILLIPIWQYPDEQAHFAQVQDIAELRKVPSGLFNASYEIALSEKILGTERDGFGNNKFTYHPQYKIPYANGLYGPEEKTITSLPESARTQLVKDEATYNPPLYYFSGSIFYRIFYHGDLFLRIFSVRIMSALFLLGTVFAAFKIGELIFIKSRIIPIILANQVAFMPMFVFASTGVLPDPLTNFLFTLVLFISLKILINGVDRVLLLAAAVTVFLGVLTRQQFLIAALIIAFPIIYRYIRTPRQIVKIFLILFFLAIFLYLINKYGTVIPVINQLRIPEFSGINLKLLLKKMFLEHILWTLEHFIREVLPWYWGVYKWLSLTVPHTIYQIINRVIIFSLVGLIIRVFLIFKTQKFAGKDLIVGYLILVSVSYFLIFLVWDYFFRINHGFSFGIQGRYFFPLIVAHLAILLYGLSELSKLILKRYAKFALFIFALLMTIFNDISLSYVAASYYDMSSLGLFINQASQYKPELLKGNIILYILALSVGIQITFFYYLARSVYSSDEK